MPVSPTPPPAISPSGLSPASPLLMAVGAAAAVALVALVRWRLLRRSSAANTRNDWNSAEAPAWVAAAGAAGLVVAWVLRDDFPFRSALAPWLTALALLTTPVFSGLSLGRLLAGRLGRFAVLVPPAVLAGAVLAATRVVEVGFWDWALESLLFAVAFALASRPSRSGGGLLPFAVAGLTLALGLGGLEAWWRAHPAVLPPTLPLSQVRLLQRAVELEHVCSLLFPDVFHSEAPTGLPAKWTEPGVWRVMHLGDSMTQGSEVDDRFVVLLGKRHPGRGASESRRERDVDGHPARAHAPVGTAPEAGRSGAARLPGK